MSKTAGRRLNPDWIEKNLQLDVSGIFDASVRLAWLDESWRNFKVFWQNLIRLRNTFFAWPGKSMPFEKYDFYHDIIVCNRLRTSPAFRWFDPLSGWCKISYAELGGRVDHTAAAWRRAGMQAGQTVCIIYPLGTEYVVALLAALKIGLVISLLPPLGESFLAKRLEILDADHIVSDAIYFSLLPGWRDRIFQKAGISEETADEAEFSYSYRSGDIAVRCFDPSSATPHEPRDVTCDQAYLCALRDGLISLGLRPGDVFAAPDFYFLETQPALILSVLLSGATLFHLEAEKIADEPEVLVRYPLKSIGISRAVREILIRKPVESSKAWSGWFRNPAESSDIGRWQLFIQMMQLNEMPAGNLKWDAACGGCSLFSMKRRGQPHLNVLPSAGVPWSLRDLADTGLETLNAFGLLAVAAIGREDGEPVVLADILSGNRREWAYAGSNVSGCCGRQYLLAEALKVVEPILKGLCCSIVRVPPSGGADPLFVLLVFTGGAADVDEADIVQRIRNTLEKELGSEFLPQRTRFFPLYPRREAGGTVDHDWCREQYLTGGLARKSEKRIHLTLSRLRRYLFWQ